MYADCAELTLQFKSRQIISSLLSPISTPSHGGMAVCTQPKSLPARSPQTATSRQQGSTGTHMVYVGAVVPVRHRPQLISSLVLGVRSRVRPLILLRMAQVRSARRQLLFVRLLDYLTKLSRSGTVSELWDLLVSIPAGQHLSHGVQRNE